MRTSEALTSLSLSTPLFTLLFSSVSPPDCRKTLWEDQGEEEEAEGWEIQGKFELIDRRLCHTRILVGSLRLKRRSTVRFIVVERAGGGGGGTGGRREAERNDETVLSDESLISCAAPGTPRLLLFFFLLIPLDARTRFLLRSLYALLSDDDSLRLPIKRKSHFLPPRSWHTLSCWQRRKKKVKQKYIHRCSPI